MSDPAPNLALLSPSLEARIMAAGGPSVSTIRAECERLRAELRAVAAFVPETVVREQLSQPPDAGGGALWNGTVLFADLSGFTALSETLSTLGRQGAEEISTIINQLFGALVDEIHHYGGTVLKFGGDALTAFFDHAILAENHASHAASAALALQRRMRAFNAVATGAGVFRLRLRIGIHSGRVFAAHVGDGEHIELVVTGRTINRVALAQEIAESGEIVISSASLALIEGAGATPRQAGFHVLTMLPQVLQPIATNPVLPPRGAGDVAELAQLDAQIGALQRYLPRSMPRRFLEEADDGEFRLVTALFINFYPFSNALDIAGDDTAVAARALNAYFRRVQQVVHRYGGIVNKVDLATYGDKIVALFGAPSANENDPELAVRAAIELRGAIAEANAEIAGLLRPLAGTLLAVDEHMLHQRIGINTGVVYAGVVGGAGRREYTVMGQNVNLAARLMSAADDNAIVLAPSTRRAVERHIAVRPLEPLRLKGIAEPVAAFEALRPFDISHEQTRVLGRARLVGRAAELEHLLAAAHTALRGVGQVVGLVGEAGVGKSRLFDEALRRMVMQSAEPGGLPPFFPYSAECQSYEQNTPYALVRQIGRQILHLDFLERAGDLGVVERRVAELAPDLARFTPLLADLTIAPIPDTPLTAALTPEQRRDRARDLFEALVLGAAHQQPLVLILDDLHWSDASSLDAINRLVERAKEAPLLLLLGYRTEPRIAEPWSTLEHGHGIVLRELSAESSAALVGELLEGPPPTGLVALLEKTQGNPFFIEEVIRGMAESGLLARGSAGWQLTRAVDEASLPDSIEGVIVARLDRLEERSREVLQIASVVGRRFPYEVLLGVLLRADDLQERLGRLTDADLILIEEIERELAYLFKHALTRDVAYEAILYARRRELHRSVARQIERLYPERIDEQLGVLARHYLAAEEWPQAFDYHVRAGQQAQARYANREAIGFYERALQIHEKRNATRGPATPATLADDDTTITCDIHERLGVIHTLIGEYDLALSHYERALEQAGSLAETPLDITVRLHHHIARVYEKRAEFETAFAWVERALAYDPELRSIESVRALLLGAGLHRRQGRYVQALEWGDRARWRAEASNSPQEQAEALLLLGGIHLGMGNNDQAFELTSHSLSLYQQLQNIPRLADAHNNLANICYELGRIDEARTNYEIGLEMKDAIGDVYGQAMIANNLGNSLRLLGDVSKAIEQYQRSLTMFTQLGSLYAAGVLHMNLGATYLLTGALASAETHLHQSVDLFGQAGAEDFLPELERYLAELQFQRGDLARAQLACELALTTAERLAARADEGSTRRILGRILAAGGDYAGAWNELERSLSILNTTASSHEIARTQVARAALAPSLGLKEQGQRALEQAAAVFTAIGAKGELNDISHMAHQYGYTMPFGTRDDD